MSDKREQVLDVIAYISGRDKATIEPEMDLVADLGIDSPKGLQLLAALEDRLELDISDEDAASMNTVADILNYVEAQ